MKLYIFSKPKYFNILITICITILIILMLFSSHTLSNIIRDNIDLFLYKLVPSVFPFILITNILIETKVAYNLTYGLASRISKLFKIPICTCPAIIFGILLGYPNAAKYLASLYSERKITSKTCQRLLSFTSNASPSFIISTIGISFYLNMRIGIILLVSHIASALILGFAICIFSKDIIHQNTENSYSFNENLETNVFTAVISSIFQTLKTLGVIFCFMTIFSIISNYICIFLKLNNNASAIITSIFEVTNGLSKISKTTFNNNTQIMLTSFFLSFGSFMILYQIYSVVYMCHVSIITFIKHKLCHGIISCSLTYILLKVIPIDYTTAPAFSNISNFKYLKTPELVYIFTITFIIIYFLFSHGIQQKKRRSKNLTAFLRGIMFNMRVFILFPDFLNYIHKGVDFLENRNFFDPYASFNAPPSNVPPAYIPSVPNGEYLGPAVTPKEFYEQQSVYYRYLTTMMEYNIKSREYEKVMHQENKRNSSQ